MSPPAELKTMARTMRDLLFPPVCLGCGGLCEAVSPMRHVCERCVPTLTRVSEPHCETCGHPFFGVVDGERMCPHCEGLRPLYGRAKTLTLFKGVARELVLSLKYRQGLFALEDMGAVLAANAEAMAFLQGGVLVPVPMHPRKLRDRTYNQSQLWAEQIVKVMGEGTRIDAVLERVQDGESQTAYDRSSRQTRMKNAFAARVGAAITPEQRYILVDDVFTTGSTLNACARVLRNAGAVTIDVITFAHG